MNNNIIEEFNNRMNDLYVDRDYYSRGWIIGKAKEILADIVKNKEQLDNTVGCANRFAGDCKRKGTSD